MWFEFSQNNSGGIFEQDDERGIGHHVWIEADDEPHAEYLAERLGIYFDGVRKGMDCPCCGDRWSIPWREEKGVSINYMYDFSWVDTVYVHYKDGTIERIKEDTEHDYKQIRNNDDYED